jgi:hypothetical protein
MTPLFENELFLKEICCDMNNTKRHELRYVVEPSTGEFYLPLEDKFVDGELLEIPTRKVREIWLKTSDGVGFLSGTDCDSLKIARFNGFAFHYGNQVAIWAPTLRLHWDGNSFEFTQGRHRFMWHWLSGYESMPFAVDRNHVPQYRKLFGLTT